MPLLLHQIKRLRELKATYSYEIAKLNQESIDATSDEELLQLLEVIELQTKLTDAINGFVRKDFAPETNMIRMALGALAHLASQMTIKGSEQLGVKMSVLGLPFIELYENNLLEHLGELPK